MKCRFGFVSNSSSSSFIIGVKNDVCPHCGNGSPFMGLLESLLSRDKDYSDDSAARAAEHMIERLRDEIRRTEEFIAKHPEYKEESEEEIADFRKTIADIEGLQSGGEWKVYELCISYADNWIKCLMDEHEKRGLLKTIGGSW